MVSKWTRFRRSCERKGSVSTEDRGSRSCGRSGRSQTTRGLLQGSHRQTVLLFSRHCLSSSSRGRAGVAERTGVLPALTELQFHRGPGIKITVIT